MTINQYRQLIESKQLDVLAQTGVLIAQRQDDFYHLDLYQIEGFYVELCYHSHFNTLLHINAFSHTNHLDPYLQQMDIDALVNV